MSHHLSRRQWLTSVAGLLATPIALGARVDEVVDRIRELERRASGRLGVCFFDTNGGRVTGYRLDERFAMCSTFKLPLAAVVLHEADAGRLSLDEKLPFSKSDLEAHAPVAREHLAHGALTVRTCIEAAQITSDNTAANLVLKRLGGPAKFTALLRAMGDETTRLDRYEPTMNLVGVGDERDTTTPRAMATWIGSVLTGDVLKAPSRELLISWMVATQTGLKRLRAGFPPAWRAGDKTGTMVGGGAVTDKYNDVAIAWPPGKPPIVVAAYYDLAVATESTSDAPQAVLADVGRHAARWASAGH
jgi:beta-lactamase class A